MYTITSLTDNQTLSIAEDQTILDATLSANIDHIHACGGNGRCSTCRVYIAEGEQNCESRGEVEEAMAQNLKFPPRIRLACQTHISGDISIRRIVADKLDIKIISEQFNDKTGTKLGREQKLAMMFTDIVNYTPFAETYPVYDTVHILNRYYRKMNAIIQQHDGIISDVAGDGILALFGIEEIPNPVLCTVKALEVMHQALREFNDYLGRMYNHSFGMRAGIHYGEVIVGEFDTGYMKKIAAIGDAVNMTSRIESANKDFGTHVLLSEEAYSMVRDEYQSKSTHAAQLKGKSGEYTLYEIEV